MEIAKKEIFETTQDYFFLWLENWIQTRGAGIEISSLVTAYFGDPEIDGNAFYVHVNKEIKEAGKTKYIERWGNVFAFTVFQLSNKDRAEIEAKCLTDIEQFIDIFNSVWGEITQKFVIIPTEDELTRKLPPIYAEDLKKVKELSLEGLTVNVISTRLGMSESKVKRHRKELGLTRRKQ
jgi:hypothetical protein